MVFVKMSGIFFNNKVSSISAPNIVLLPIKTMPPSSLFVDSKKLRYTKAGRTINKTEKAQIKNGTPISFSSKIQGIAIPIEQCPRLPSGFPYFQKLSLVSSSVKIYNLLNRATKLTLYAFVSLMKSWTAVGLSGFLSGCTLRDSCLYYFLIVRSSVV